MRDEAKEKNEAAKAHQRSDLYAYTDDSGGNGGGDVEFQVFSWHSCDEDRGEEDTASSRKKDDSNDDDDDEDDDEGGGGPFAESAFLIKMFGVRRDGAPVSATVRGFRPEFYVRVPAECTAAPSTPRATAADVSAHVRGKAHVSVVTDAARQLMQMSRDRRFGGRKGELADVSVVFRKNFWGFTNGMREPFVRLVFRSHAAMRHMAAFLYRQPLRLKGARTNPVRLELFESNIDPLLRFVHMRGLNAAGWVRLPRGAYETRCDVLPAAAPPMSSMSPNLPTCRDYAVYWKHVEPVVGREEIAPMLVASFDIECNSSHGDFPVANKTYRKLAGELYDYHAAQAARPPEERPTDYELCAALAACIRHAFGLACTEEDREALRRGGLPDADAVNATIRPVYPKGGGSPRPGTPEAEKLRQMSVAVVDDIFCVLSGGRGKGALPGALVPAAGPPSPGGGGGGEEGGGSDGRHLHPRARSSGGGRGRSGGQGQQACLRRGSDGRVVLVKSAAASRVQAQAEEARRAQQQQQQQLNAGAKASAIVRLFEACRFPPLEGDEIIQVGTTFHRYGDTSCCFRHIVALGACEPAGDGDDNERDEQNGNIIARTVTESRATERELLLAWADMIAALDPDVVTGYNVFGFDFAYLNARAEELGVGRAFMRRLGRLADVPATFVEKQQSSSAMGDNTLTLIEMPGRVVFDLMKLMQYGHKLDSHSLDNVARHFLGLHKHDVSPADIFRLQRGSAADRKVIADYCLQDCALVNRLVVKLEVLANNLGMANVCSVPLAYLFMRGQGVKIFSLVARQCLQDGFVLPTLERPLSPEEAEEKRQKASQQEADARARRRRWRRDRLRRLRNAAAADEGGGGDDDDIDDDDNDEEEEEDGGGGGGEGEGGGAGSAEEVGSDKYEGAIVLEPVVGIYADDPVAVLDYASLYPSSMISENISHDCLVLDERFGALPGIDYVTVRYDTPRGEVACRYAQIPGKGVLPRILMTLLAQRKATRKRIALQAVDVRMISSDNVVAVVGSFDEDKGVFAPAATSSSSEHVPPRARQPFVPSPEERATLRPAHNAFQAAILDGLQNAYKVTANSLYGQMGAKTSPLYMKHVAASTTATGRNLILKAKAFMEGHCGARVVYGDTDSLFMTFDTYDEATGRRLRGREALAPTMERAKRASALYKPQLKPPHDMEYEKTFWPFIIFSKKRYVGNLYEDDPDATPKQKSMGIVLKRRDNAPIVKTVFGGVIDILLNRRDLRAAVDFLRARLDELADGKTPIEQLIVTKTLRAFYAQPEHIAHNVLAQRMGERDPGNKPQSNDRIPYVYIVPPPELLRELPPGKAPLQGDRIEHPQYVLQRRLRVDYAHYITNQIMKPVLQLFAVLIEQLEGCARPPGYWDAMRVQLGEHYDAVTDAQACKLEEQLMKDRHAARARVASRQAERRAAVVDARKRQQQQQAHAKTGGGGGDESSERTSESKHESKHESKRESKHESKPLPPQETTNDAEERENRKRQEAADARLARMTDADVYAEKRRKIAERDASRDVYVNNKYDEKREKDAKSVLFDPVLRRLEAAAAGQRTLASFFHAAPPAASSSSSSSSDPNPPDPSQQRARPQRQQKQQKEQQQQQQVGEGNGGGGSSGCGSSSNRGGTGTGGRGRGGRGRGEKAKKNASIKLYARARETEEMARAAAAEAQHDVCC